MLSKYLKLLFKLLQINNKLKLNGSYETSIYASDIDLYNKMRKNELQLLNKKLNNLKQLLNEYDKTILITDVKIQTTNKKYKLKDVSKIDLSKYKNIEYVKVDLLLFHFIFPIELSIIYNVSDKFDLNKTVKSIASDILTDDITLYKKIKRINSLLKINGKDPIFNDILNDHEIGNIYQSITRLEILDKFKNNIPDIQKYYDIIQETLNKYNLSLSDDLSTILNNKIQAKLKNI